MPQTRRERAVADKQEESRKPLDVGGWMGLPHCARAEDVTASLFFFEIRGYENRPKRK